jgi:NADH-quinone oxidoreductase subunit J
MVINILLLVALLASAIWAVITIRLLRSAIGLAVASAILTVLLYRLGYTYAAAFELSVCSGLISVIFISTISLTQRLTSERLIMREKDVLRKFWLLPVILIVVGIFLAQADIPLQMPPRSAEGGDVRAILWHQRHLDLLGQIIILLSGAIGVVLLFKEKRNG